ncbi:class F sortase, partial [Streptomyces palmae]
SPSPSSLPAPERLHLPPAARPDPAMFPPRPRRPREPSLPRSYPVRLKIPSIKVNAPFTELTLDKSGRLQAPPPNDKNLVGWFRDGASPGERGNAIVAGHVDTKTGPAVFYPLSALKTKSKVVVERADGVRATFVVDEVSVFSKKKFPNKRVYGETYDPQLRLITCGGSYDRKVKDYTANVVVFAHLDSFTWS